MANWSDEEFDSTLMDAMSADDEERQNELYGRCQEIIHERGPYAIPFFVDQRTAWRNSVEGYDISATDTFLNMMEVTNG
jgi:ABC-type transport system substrate-binding protein